MFLPDSITVCKKLVNLIYDKSLTSEDENTFKLNLIDISQIGMHISNCKYCKKEFEILAQQLTTNKNEDK